MIALLSLALLSAAPGESRAPLSPTASSLLSDAPVAESTLSPKSSRPLYYPSEVAQALHAAQVRYAWSLAFKISSVPLALYGAFNGVGALGQSGQAQGAMFLQAMISLGASAVLAGVASLIDDAAAAKIEAAAEKDRDGKKKPAEE